MGMKKLASLLIALLLNACGLSWAEEEPPASTDAHDLSSKGFTQLVSVGDSLSTYAALQSPSVGEQNGLVNPSPAGLLTLLGVKLLTVEYAETLDKPTRDDCMRTFSTIWGWGNANNIAIALGASFPIAWLAGLATGSMIWDRQTAVIQQEHLAQEQLRNSQTRIALLEE